MNNNRATPKMRAFAVTEEYENIGCVIFARHAITALKMGASEIAHGDWRACRAVRAAWADEFCETGIVPQSVAVAHGWNFECAGCGARIDEGWLYHNELKCEDVQGSMRSKAYCCRVCQLDDIERSARIEAAKQRGLTVLRDYLKQRLPFAKETTSYGYAVERDGQALFVEGQIKFSFPGQKIGDAVLDMRRGPEFRRVGPIKPEFRCCHGDIEAFKSLLSANYISN